MHDYNIPVKIIRCPYIHPEDVNSIVVDLEIGFILISHSQIVWNDERTA